MRILIVILLSILISGCVTVGPIKEEEYFSQRNQDPEQGLIINEGTAHLNLYIYDEVGRLVEQVYLAGANRWLTINGQTLPRYWIRKLEIGQYRIEVFPFYYMTQLIPPKRYQIDLPKQTVYLEVGRNPTRYYYGGRHWSWVLKLNGGSVPDTAHGLPGIKLDIRGDFNRGR